MMLISMRNESTQRPNYPISMHLKTKEESSRRGWKDIKWKKKPEGVANPEEEPEDGLTYHDLNGEEEDT